MPQMGETVLEGTVSTWYKKPGDSVAADEVLFEVETEKVTTEIPSPGKGILVSILVPAGTSVPVGTVLAVLDSGDGATQPATARPVPTGAGAPPPASSPAVAASTAGPALREEGARERDAQRHSPVVMRLLSEHGINASSIQGTGRDGRLTREDVLAAVEARSGGDQRIPLNNIRRATADHMVRSLATSAHTLQAVEVDFDGVVQAQRALGESWKAKEGFALTFLPFVAAAVCRAIAKFPHVNASFGAGELIVHRGVHLAIAVDLAFEGLVAPVLRDANRLGVRELARGFAALASRARAGSLSPDELKGGTYTISNSGSFGTLFTAPIISQPQVAILSTDGVRKRPVVIEGPGGDTIAIRPVGILAQSFDHRAFDGAYSAAFLREVRRGIEEQDWLAELNRDEKEPGR